MEKEISSFGNSKFKRNLITINIIIIILIASFFIIASLIQDVVIQQLIKGSAIYIENEDITNSVRDFSYYIKDKYDPFKEEFTAEVLKFNIDKIGEEKLQIFTSMIQSEAFEIYINDEVVATEGDITNFNSSIWSNNYRYTVSSELFDKKVNTIKIVQYSRYMGGAQGTPFIIAGYSGSTVLRNLEIFDLHQIVIGVAIGLAFLLILMMVLLPSRRKIYNLIMIALFLMVISYLEYFEFNHLGCNFLIFKKLIVSATLISVGLGTALFRDLFVNKKHTFKIIIIYSLIIIIPTLFMSNMIMYKKMYTIVSLAIIPTLIYWGYIAIRNYKIYEEGKMVLAMTSAFVGYIVIWNVGEMTGLAYLPSSTIVMLPLFIVVSFTLIIIDIYELRLNVATSRIRYNDAYRKSIIDNLTGLYNAKHMKDLIEAMIGPYTVAMIDIDDFKKINDEYGHLAGDKALADVASTITKLLREEDALGRYGGDEFVCFLRTDNANDANKIFERIKYTVEQKQYEFEEHKLKITISIGFYVALGNESFEYLVAKSDKALYFAKNNGKNMVCNLENYTDEQILFDEEHRKI